MAAILMPDFLLSLRKIVQGNWHVFRISSRISFLGYELWIPRRYKYRLRYGKSSRWGRKLASTGLFKRLSKHLCCHSRVSPVVVDIAELNSFSYRTCSLSSFSYLHLDADLTKIKILKWVSNIETKRHTTDLPSSRLFANSPTLSKPHPHLTLHPQPRINALPRRCRIHDLEIEIPEQLYFLLALSILFISIRLITTYLKYHLIQLQHCYRSSKTRILPIPEIQLYGFEHPFQVLLIFLVQPPLRPTQIGILPKHGLIPLDSPTRRPNFCSTQIITLSPSISNSSPWGGWLYWTFPLQGPDP